MSLFGLDVGTLGCEVIIFDVERNILAPVALNPGCFIYKRTGLNLILEYIGLGER